MVGLWVLRRPLPVQRIFAVVVCLFAVGCQLLRLVRDRLEPHRAPSLTQVVPHQNGLPDLVKELIRRQRKTFPVQIVLRLSGKALQ